MRSVFVVGLVVGDDGVLGVAAVVREDGRVGLPGGKVEPGESPAFAAAREAMEEGWWVVGGATRLRYLYRASVEGAPVEWFYAPLLEPVAPREGETARPVVVPPTRLSPGLKNEEPVARALELLDDPAADQGWDDDDRFFEEQEEWIRERERAGAEAPPMQKQPGDGWRGQL